MRHSRHTITEVKAKDYFDLEVLDWLYNRVLDYFGEWSYADYDMSEYPYKVRKWFRTWRKKLLEYRDENGIKDFDKVKNKVLNTAVKELENISKELEDMDESYRHGSLIKEDVCEDDVRYERALGEYVTAANAYSDVTRSKTLDDAIDKLHNFAIKKEQELKRIANELGRW